MTDTSPTTVHCSVLAPFWNIVHVLTQDLQASFTLGEVLVIFGNQAVLDLHRHRHVTLAVTWPIAWPLHLKHPPADLVQQFPPVIRPVPVVVAAGDQK